MEYGTVLGQQVGGGILNEGFLTVSSCHLYYDWAYEGGAIYNSGTLTVFASVFEDNNAAAYGGAIYNGGTLVVNNNCFFGANNAFDGGAIFTYGSARPEICRELADIVVEELDHFRQVLDLLDQRQIRFRPQRPSDYGRQLNELVRKTEPERAIDRLLVASLIEARSCERFALLRDRVPDRVLGEFYGSLFESEARHHATYVRMAGEFGTAESIHARLEVLAACESKLILEGSELPRMHS